MTLIVGDESLLVERAVAGVRAEFGAGVDVHDVNAADLAPGELSGLTAPSLFGGDCVVIVRAAQDAIYKWKWAPASHETREPIEVRFDPQ